MSMFFGPVETLADKVECCLLFFQLSNNQVAPGKRYRENLEKLTVSVKIKEINSKRLGRVSAGVMPTQNSWFETESWGQTSIRLGFCIKMNLNGLSRIIIIQRF